MNYLSLYRKYRPHSFEEVVGQQYIVQILKNSIKNNKVANAYVFAGTKGTGKTSIAKIYANAVNCLDNKNGDVCHKCEICKDFENNQIMDVIELDAASNNGVDDIRKISDGVYTLPVKLVKKVYIIDEAHMLTTQAWNALLKVVEEPPKHVMFIFATTEIHKIPATILSRCQCFRFSKLSNSDIVKLLENVCKKEKFKYDLEALKIIAQLADGSARDSLSILDEVSTFTDNNINSNDIYKIYGLLSLDELVSFINLFNESNTSLIFKQVNEYIQSGINFGNFISMLISVLTDKVIYLKTNNYELLTRTNEKLMNDLRINDVKLLLQIIDIWQEAYFKLSSPSDVNIIIQTSIIKTLDVLSNSNTVDKQEEIQPIKQVINKTTIKKETISKYKDVETPESFNFNPKFEEIKFLQKTQPVKKPTIKSTKEEDTKIPSIEDLLLSAVSNNSSAKKTEANKILKDIKDSVLNVKEFDLISLAKQCVFASANTIVYAFEDELDALKLNQNSFTNKFILATCNVFRDPKYIIGFSIKQINSKKDTLKKAMKEKNIDEFSVEPLRNVMNSDLSIQQLAYNTIYSKLDKKDRK